MIQHVRGSHAIAAAFAVDAALATVSKGSPNEVLVTDEHRDFWTRVAPKYDGVVDLQIGGSTRSLLRERLAKEGGLGALVELGCGTGFYTSVLAEKADAVTATDLSPGMLALARDRITAPNVTFRVEDCQRTSFPDGAFDAAFMSLVIQFTEPEATLAEIRRVLKPGGTVIILNLDMPALRGLDRVRSLARVVCSCSPPTGHIDVESFMAEDVRRPAPEASLRERHLDAFHAELELDTLARRLCLDDHAILVLHRGDTAAAADRRSGTHGGVSSVEVLEPLQMVDGARRAGAADADGAHGQTVHLDRIRLSPIPESSAAPAEADSRSHGSARELYRGVRTSTARPRVRSVRAQRARCHDEQHSHRPSHHVRLLSAAAGHMHTGCATANYVYRCTLRKRRGRRADGPRVSE
jgi:SAM-dependent methyltransferase